MLLSPIYCQHDTPFSIPICRKSVLSWGVFITCESIKDLSKSMIPRFQQLCPPRPAVCSQRHFFCQGLSLLLLTPVCIEIPAVGSLGSLWNFPLCKALIPPSLSFSGLWWCPTSTAASSWPHRTAAPWPVQGLQSCSAKAPVHLQV